MHTAGSLPLTCCDTIAAVTLVSIPLVLLRFRKAEREQGFSCDESPQDPLRSPCSPRSLSSVPCGHQPDVVSPVHIGWLTSMPLPVFLQFPGSGTRDVAFLYVLGRPLCCCVWLPSHTSVRPHSSCFPRHSHFLTYGSCLARFHCRNGKNAL